jgi:hypothetical protein
MAGDYQAVGSGWCFARAEWWMKSGPGSLRGRWQVMIVLDNFEHVPRSLENRPLVAIILLVRIGGESDRADEIRTAFAERAPGPPGTRGLLRSSGDRSAAVCIFLTIVRKVSLSLDRHQSIKRSNH